MTSTALMTVQSRSSLRVLRRDPKGAADHADQPPPAKRPRLYHPAPSRRRKSSPDLLDTTIETPPSGSTKLRRPRPLFALSSSTSSAPPPAGSTPRARNLHAPRHDTGTSNNAALYLNGARESPDPLDTISPAPATVTVKPAPKHTNTPTSAAYRQRRITHFLKSASDQAPTTKSGKPEKTRPSRGSAPGPRSASIPQPAPVSAGTADRAVPDKRRSLRSHDGSSRARGELALYFPNYEEIVSLEPPKTEFLTGNTIIKLIDDLHEPPIPPSALSGPDADTPFGNPLVNLHGCEVIALPDPPVHSSDGAATESGPSDWNKEEEEDPLNDEVYFKSHRRHERQEKQLRNIERDRAQHEKQQLDRLLEELQSQDWLRVMGITGRSLTDQEKKLYEPKRDYFIKEISALLQKFKIWKEEEKRRKLDKSASFHSDARESSQARNKYAKSEEPDEGQEVPATPPDINDVDALAARQLLQEARSATAGKRPSKAKSDPHILPPPPEPDKPFTSFFSKPHLREAAISGHRKGRTRFAFGHPIPEVPEREFKLPGDILTPEAIKSCQRKRRRMKRGSLGDG